MVAIQEEASGDRLLTLGEASVDDMLDELRRRGLTYVFGCDDLSLSGDAIRGWRAAGHKGVQCLIATDLHCIFDVGFPKSLPQQEGLSEDRRQESLAGAIFPSEDVAW